MVTDGLEGVERSGSMWRWIKRVAHFLAVRLYGTFELLDIPKIRDLPGDTEPGR